MSESRMDFEPLKPSLTDRSRSICYQVCPRMRYWQYEYKGRGVVPRRAGIPLTTGGAVHKGLEVLLLHTTHTALDLVKQEDCIESAVEAALVEYDAQVGKRNFQLSDEEDENYVYYEQRALIEALVRAWALARLPHFSATYEVLDVEREEVMGLNLGVVFMARPDGVLRHRQSGGIYILSFKTTSGFTDLDEQRARYDVQGLSELAVVEQRMKERVAGIHMEFLIKGQRRRDSQTRAYVQDSPLVRPWLKQGIVGAGDEWAWKYYFQDALSGANRNLGRSFRRVNVWEHMPIKEWVEMLHRGEVQPELGDALDQFFYVPVPYQRTEEDVRAWRAQTSFQEEKLREAALLSGGLAEPPPNILDWYYPQYRHSCIQYQAPCQYVPLCFGGESPNPDVSTLYDWREPHHQLEVEEFEKEEIANE